MLIVARNLIVGNFDELLDTALLELSNRYQHKEFSVEEKESLRKGAVGILPDQYEYGVDEFRLCSKSKFKLSFSSRHLNIDNIEGWLIKFQLINNATLNVKVKKKPTKGYLLQHCSRCQHSTRKWNTYSGSISKFVEIFTIEVMHNFT